MGSLVKKQTEKFLRDKKRRKRWMAMFLCLALLVTSGTFAALRMDGRAMDDDGNAESGTEVYDENLYAGEPVQDSAQGEQGETGGSLDGEDAGQPEMDDPDAGNADIGVNPDGEDAGQPEINDPDAGNMDMGTQEPENPDTGDTEIGEQQPEDPGTETADPNEDIEGGQPDEGNTPEEDAQQPDDQISEIRKNVIAIAESQLGYTYEDYKDFDEKNICQEDWTALFASYSLIMAEVRDIQLETDSRQWMDSLDQEGGLYRDDTYSPKPGDIVFYSLTPETPEVSDASESAYGLTGENEVNEEGTVQTEGAADTDAIRAGLVKEWNAKTGEIQIIAGGVETDGAEQARVNETTYSLSGEDPQINIKAYSQIPETAAQEPGTENGTPEEPETNGDTVSDPDTMTVSPNETNTDEATDGTDDNSTASNNPFSWGNLTHQDVEVRVDEATGVKTWNVSETTHRYLEIPVCLNASGDIKRGTKITFPSPLDLGQAGRKLTTKEGESTYTAEFKTEGISEKEWTKQEEGKTLTLTSQGDHVNLDVFYEFDCWNVVSDEEFELKIKVEIPEQEEQTYTLKGKIKTGHKVEIIEYLNGVGNSDYAFDGFGGADKATAYIPKWNPVYQEYFGLNESDFDSEDYIYDIAAFAIRPEYQQPYDISGSFKPGNGELIGGIYMMDARENPDALCIKLDMDPNKDENGGHSFAIKNNERLILDGNHYAVVSNLSDTTDKKIYTLYFLVKYPRQSKVQKTDDKDQLVYDQNGDPVMVEPDIELKAELALKHTGVDNREVRETQKEITLYKGNQGYRNRIYWASYNPETGVNPSGLTALLGGNNAFADFSADFYCLNENRDDFNYSNSDPKRYRLEAVIDLAYLFDTDVTKNFGRLGENDYQFSAIKLSLIDAPGAWSHNNHGVPNVGWEPEHYSDYGPIPSWADDEYIKIYGSKTLSNDGDGGWTEVVEPIRASDVWAEDQDRGYKGSTYQRRITEEGYVRLKVVYESRWTTALRVGYEMQVKPSALDKVSSKGQNVETLGLRSWFNYLAYDGNDPDEKAKDFYHGAVEDQKDSYGVKTYEDARDFDQGNPYPGFIPPTTTWDETCTLRNRATITLEKSEEYAGMLVTQALYDSSGKVIGEWGTEGDIALNPNNSYSNQTNVTNVSEIVYSITGAVTNKAVSKTALDDNREKSPLQPYKAMKQRYYVLLPEGLTLNMQPDGEHYQEKRSESYLSPFAAFYKGTGNSKTLYGGNEGQPISKGQIANWKEVNSWGHRSAMAWDNKWPEDEKHGFIVRRQDLENNKQLFIFDRTLEQDSSNAFNMWADTDVSYFWGQGFSFSVVPERGTGTLDQGDYTPLFWCQFLDEQGQPITMNGFLQSSGDKDDEEYQKLITADDGYGNNLDKSTLLHIPATFTNRSASGSSKAEINLINDTPESGQNDTVELEGKYRYELKYEITNRRSRNVVLWCNIEKYNRGGKNSEWNGIVKSVDLNGNTPKVYVRTDEGGFNANEYVAGANKEWLNDGKHGWTLVENPETYGDWENVKSIAFDFGNREFNADGDKSASVFIEMQAPDKGGVNRKPYQTTYTTYNELIFSDEQGEANEPKPGQGLVGPTELKLFIPGETYELPSTGGTGIYWYTIGGMLLMMSTSLILYKKRRKRAAQE